MLMILLLVLLIAAFYHISQAVVSRRSKADPVALALLLQTGTSLPIILALAIWAEPNWGNLLTLGWVGATFAIAWTLNIYFDLLSLKRIDASLFVLVNFPSQVALTIWLSTLLLGEGLAGKQYLGLALLMAGVVVAHLSHFKGNTLKGLVYALLSAVVASLGLVSEKVIFDQASNWATYIMGVAVLLMAGSVAFYILHRSLSADSFKIPLKRLPIKPLLLTIAFSVMAVTGYGWALYQTDNLAYLNALWQLSMVMIVIMGMIILKETDHKLIKICGSILATGGFLLLV